MTLSRRGRRVVDYAIVEGRNDHGQIERSVRDMLSPETTGERWSLWGPPLRIPDPESEDGWQYAQAMVLYEEDER